MSEERINYINAILGRRGSGKTFYLKNELIPTYQKHHAQKKILIVDTIDHPDWQDIPIIDISMISRWKGANIYRVIGYDTESIINEIEASLKNALIIFEDASKYMENRSSMDTRRLCFDSKQKNNDIIFLFHGFIAMPSDLFKMADNIVLFKTSDHPAARKNAIPDYEAILEAYEKVKKDPSPVAKLTINLFS